jgi:hypothetical protein
VDQKKVARCAIFAKSPRCEPSKHDPIPTHFGAGDHSLASVLLAQTRAKVNKGARFVQLLVPIIGPGNVIGARSESKEREQGVRARSESKG